VQDDVPAPDHRAERALEILQTVLTGLILAFIVRAFLVEPFIIPTGSMADALLGAHATRTCPACGWEYNFAPLRNGDDGAGFVRPPEIICPNCQLRSRPTAEDTIPRAGDRILVHKWPYALGIFGPSRWDVIVFRDPANPDQHYIKRVIGKPGEAVEIIDGDIYIDGRIERKPSHIQRGMWFIVFDQAYWPDADSPSGRWPRWTHTGPPALGEGGWYGMETRVIRHETGDGAPHVLTFNADTGREYLRDLYAYDRGSSGALVGDIRVFAEVTVSSGTGWFQWVLDRPPYRFTLCLDAAGQAELRMRSNGAEEPDRLIATYSCAAMSDGKPLAVEFGHVDYRVYVKLNGQEVITTTDEVYTPDIEQLRLAPGRRPVGIQLAAQDLNLALRGLRIDRDVHYTRTSSSERAYAGSPFALREDEYFVLGDNSPDSHDGREWTKAGMHMPDDYRPGTVRADQIVGQAAFVYLPGLFPLDSRGRWFLPDLGRVRFVR
jgi:signal peptidase I